MEKDINIITAVGNYVPGEGYPIGKNGNLPWHNPNDLKWFKSITTTNVVIMGRKTYESIGKPLPNRINIVISKKPTTEIDINGVFWVDSVEKAITKAEEFKDKKIFVIGGESIYKYVLDHDFVDYIYIDFLNEQVDGATAFFPTFLTNGYWIQDGGITKVDNYKAYAIKYARARGMDNDVDLQYQKLLKDIIDNGVKKNTRAGKTISVFGRQLRFNLKSGLPMLTTKKMFSKGVIHELLWFLKGDTNIKYLVDNNVHIWDDDAYRFYLEMINSLDNEQYALKYLGEEDVKETETVKSCIQESVTILTKEEFLGKVKEGWVLYHLFDDNIIYRFGDLGPVYGKQWRNWNGIDQIAELIETLKNNPDDRRLIISSWNVKDIPSMALPPCHYSCQFYTKEMTHVERSSWLSANLLQQDEYVDFPDETLDKHNVPKRKLSCMWNQRSVDTLLGLPFNILSYAILTHMIAQCANMEVDELIFNGGDVHIYENQLEMAKEQLSRYPRKYALPQLKLNGNIKNINDFKYDDITIVGYHSYPAIKIPLSVGL